MKTMTAAYVRDNVRELLDSAIADRPVLITRHGKTVAVVLPTAFLPMSFLNDASDEK